MQLALALAYTDASAQAPSEISAVYATTPSYLDLPFAFAESAAASLPLLQGLDTQRSDEARKLFDRVNASAKAPMRWHELRGEALISGMTRHALFAGIVVFGQHDASNLQSLGVPADFVESVLIASGKPGLVLPCAGSFPTVGREVLVAWKPTREAARALSASIPLLQRAKRIHVVGEAGNEQREPRDGDLQRYLRSHGIEANIERHAAIAAESSGEGLLSLAAHVGADLLVMGCYGHSRARELVLGGASRTVLRSMTLPVLMAH